MRYFSSLVLFLLSFASIASEIVNTKDPVAFFTQIKENEQKKSFNFNEYEHIISGTSAFILGNLGYLLSDSPVLKISFTGIQTIGIINIGQGVYMRNAPVLKESLSDIISNQDKHQYSKNELASELIETFAKQNRAKRLSLFYSTAFLSLQYFLNATIYESPERLRNIYVFLGSVNAIVATYSAMYKDEYEEYHYGNGLDLNPFAALGRDNEVLMGANLTLSF